MNYNKIDYLTIAINYREGFKLVEYGGKFGFIDEIGNLAIPCKYDAIKDKGSEINYMGQYVFSEGYAAVKLNNKWGFIDKTGKAITVFKYDNVVGFREGRAIVWVKDKNSVKCGFIDQTGREIIPLKYDCANAFSEGLAGVKLNQKWGCIDKNGKEVILFKYDGAEPFQNGFAAVNLNKKWGLIDKTGKEVVPCEYDTFFDVHSIRNKITDTSERGKITDIKYDDSFYFKEYGLAKVKLAKVKLNGKYGFIDTTGKEVIPAIYDEIIKDFNDNRLDSGVPCVNVCINGEKYSINIYGGKSSLIYRLTDETYDSVEIIENSLKNELGINEYNRSISHYFIDLFVIFDNCKDIRLAMEICERNGAELAFCRNKNAIPPKSNRGTSSGGCYIATACYGSYDCAQVLTFRHFRDEYLSRTIAGRIFINTYYALSPALAKWLTNKHVVNGFVRSVLLNPIYILLRKKF